MDYFKSRFVDELNAEGEVEIAGNTWSRHEVLETMDKTAASNLLNGWVGEAKLAARARVDESLRQTGCRARFDTLLNRHAAGNLVPVIGAGMSASSGFPLWGPFLLDLAADLADRDKVVAMLNKGKFEEAAQLVMDIRGDEEVTEHIHNTFGSHRKQVSGPARLLPQVFQAEVITTNFDYVTDAVYRDAGADFRLTLSGPELRGAPQRIGNDPHCLLRLHGEGDTSRSRVLSMTEYQAAYDDDHTLHGVLGAIVGLRSLVFLGCSLTSDRTVQALQRLREAAVVDPPRHYAILPAPEPEARAARSRALARAGIYPIYYPPEDHDQGIEDLLVAMMEGGL